MKVLFHTNHLGLRGVECAMYDYAHFNEIVLGNKSVVISNRNNPLNHPLAIEKFSKRFPVYLYEDAMEIDQVVKNEKIDCFYAQKYGIRDNVFTSQCKNVVHTVFPVKEVHGDVYAYISDWLAKEMEYPFSVPYIVTLPETLSQYRQSLGIPEDAIVFGRYGRAETFDIPFVYEVVDKISDEYENIDFLFMNTNPFSSSLKKNIIYLPATANLEEKAAFINTSNAMLHARRQGETFGLAVAEFGIKGKPIFTYAESPERCHIELMGNLGIYYKDADQLYNSLIEFAKNPYVDRQLAEVYSQFNPQSVMERFREVFLGTPHELALAGSRLLLQQAQKRLEKSQSEEVKQLQSENYELCLRLGDDLLNLGHFQEAITHYRRSVDLNPNAESYSKLGDALIKLGSCESDPKYAQIYFNLGKNYAQQGKLAEALVFYIKSITLRPNISGGYKSLALVWQQLGKLEKAADCWYQAVIQEPEITQQSEIFRFVNYLLDRGEINEAISFYERLIQTTPQEIKIYHQLGDIFLKQDRLEEAIVTYRRAVALHPNYSQQSFWGDMHAIKTVGVNAEQLIRVDGKEYRYESPRQITSLEVNEGMVFYGPYIDLTDGLYKVSVNYDIAQLETNTISERLDVIGFSLDLVTDRGQCVWYEDKVDINKKTLQFVIELIEATNTEIRFYAHKREFSINSIEFRLLYDPVSNPTYYSELAVVLKTKGLLAKAGFSCRLASELHLKAGNQEEALTCYQKVLQMEPYQEEANSKLGLQLVKGGLLNEVIGCYDLALNRSPNSAGTYYKLSVLLAEEGLMNEAIFCFKQAPQPPINSGEIYDYIWRGLNQLGSLDESSPYCLKEVYPESAEDYFRSRSKYKVMTLDALTTEDRVFLEKNGLSLANIEVIKQTNIFLEEIYVNSFYAMPMVHQYNLRKKVHISVPKAWENQENRASIQSLIETGYIYSVCPFHGKILRSNQSFHNVSRNSWLETYIYRFVGQETFYLIIAHWWNTKVGIYLPSLDLIIAFHNPYPDGLIYEDIINKFKAYTVGHWQLFQRYITSTEKKVLTAITGVFPNIAHYFWQEVTGIQHLYANGLLQSVEHFLIGSNSYFDITDIYPEIPSSKVVRCKDNDSIFKMTLENNWVVTKLTDWWITEELATRINQAAIQKCSESFHKQVDEAKNHFPLLWIYIRSNRTSTSQVEGIANLINEIYRNFPELGVIFDGWGRREQEDDHADIMIEKEQAIVKEILELLPEGVNTYSTIGSKNYEKIVFANACHVYLASEGAGLAFLVWLANKKGVVHTNNMRREITQDFWLGNKENCVPPIFLERQYITDEPNSSSPFCSYDCDWNVIYEEIMKILPEKLNS
jgi:tetratricopeptide (TPR) repeat protein